MTTPELPPLPVPGHSRRDEDAFTEEQLREYATAALKAAQERIAELEAQMDSAVPSSSTAACLPITQAKLTAMLADAFLEGSKKGIEVAIADLTEQGLIVNPAKHQSTAAACLPLTEHQLDEALMTIPDTGREWNCVEICRAVERAHGIEHSAEAEKQNLPKRYIAGTPW